jgi:hypothetical protein
MKRFLLAICVFALIGEAVLRFDKATLFFRGTRFEAIHESAKPSREISLLDASRFIPDSTCLRVMLLGDSKLYGAGVDLDSVFARHLQRLLFRSEQQNFEKVNVLDVTIPGANTQTNARVFRQHFTAYAPHIVVLGYNYDDVYQTVDSINTTTEVLTPGATTLTDRWINAFVAAKNVVYRSELLQYAFVNLSLELKIAGVILPGSVMHHMIYRAYDASYPGWQASQAEFGAIADSCRSHALPFMVYLVPQLEVLENHAMFDRVDAILIPALKSAGAQVVRGVEPFLGSRNEDFALSRYDGHPNEAAHRIMARQVAAAIDSAITNGPRTIRRSPNH